MFRLALFVFLLQPLGCFQDAPSDSSDPIPLAKPPTGVLRSSADVQPGYTLFAPLNSGSTWLIDNDGQVVHAWHSETMPGSSVYLLPSGNLLRAERPAIESAIQGGGEGGRIVELTWDGEQVWTYTLCNSQLRLHHDIEPLPNGNVLAIAWKALSRDAAIKLGRSAESLGPEGFWPDAIFELEPIRPEGAKIVWEWHAADHLIQAHSETAPHYGVVSEHPRRINVNIGTPAAERPETPEDRKRRIELERALSALGYTGGNDDDDEDAPDQGAPRMRADWMHTNSVDYDPELDLIAISLRNFDEVWVIDHATTTTQARGSVGGRQGVGGDLVWRYGNPSNYHADESRNRVCFGQHDAQWTRIDGQPVLTIFNNGEGRPGTELFSSVDWIAIPVDENGVVRGLVDGRFEPSQPLRTWTAAERTSLFSGRISGADPLPHGGALVCNGEQGHLFEVSADGRVLWEYLSPFAGNLKRRPNGGDINNRSIHAGRSPRSKNAMFRATRIAPDHPGLAGRELVPKPL